jgi:hypothetical protein
MLARGEEVQLVAVVSVAGRERDQYDDHGPGDQSNAPVHALNGYRIAADIRGPPGCTSRKTGLHLLRPGRACDSIDAGPRKPPSAAGSGRILGRWG